MIEFLKTLTDPSMVFLKYTVYIGIFSSVTFGIIGTFVVVKRISYMAGAISHCVLGGIGLGLYLNQALKITWITPTIGATFSTLVAATTIWALKSFVQQREDTAIGAVWALGMASGLIFISITPGYIDAMSYLFGSILLVGPKDFYIVTILDIIILVLVTFFYNKLVAISFDEEFAKLRGINTQGYNLLLLSLVALTIVLLINIVGIVLIIALLTIPQAMASMFTKKMSTMMILSILICLVGNVSGIIVSYNYDLPIGPIIIVLISTLYFILLILKKIKLP